MKTKYYIIAAAVVALIIFFGIRSCSTKKLEKQKLEQQISTALTRQSDSLQTAFHKVEFARLDSAKKAEAVKTEKAKELVVFHEAIAKKYLAKANSLQSKLDSLINNDSPCDEQIAVCVEVNKGLRQVLFERDTVIESLGKEAESYSMQLYLSERQNAGNAVLIAEKDKAIKKLNEIILISEIHAKKMERKYTTGKFIRNLIIGFETTAIVLISLRK